MSDFRNKFPEVLKFFNCNEFAATTFVNKYALKDSTGETIETNPNETILRVMKYIASFMPEDKILDACYDKNSNSTCKLSFPSEKWLERVLKDQYSPLRADYHVYTWLELFISACCGFKGLCPQGSILASAGISNSLQSLSNCFVIPSPADDIHGIMKTSEEIAQVTKRRGGVGFDISTLRPYGTEVSNAAKTSTGVYGFMDHFSNVCRTIAQLGRRGAMMISLDVRHPDAELFAKAKRDLKYCTGANISIKISDEFMLAVQNNTDFIQQFPINSDSPIIKKTIKARDLWNVICESAHGMAEPGLLMWDNITKNLPAHQYDNFKTSSTNPCSELPLSDYDSCRLSTICLVKYVKNSFEKDSYFDYDEFEKDVRISMRFMDAVVSAEAAAIDRIIEKIKLDERNETELTLWKSVKKSTISGRRCGLGTHGLGDCLIRLGIKYDTQKAIDFLNKLYSLFRDSAYDESIEMAIDYGKFEGYDFDKDIQCDYIKRLPQHLLDKLKKYGRRNISILTMAPAGTISILSGCTSGIEPLFRAVYKRRKKVNPDDIGVNVDFIDELGDKWTTSLQFESCVEEYLKKKNININEIKDEKQLKDILPDYFVTSDNIDWKMRLKVQSTIQQYIDHSISSTINLPKETDINTVKKIYETAWKLRLKGITVYRDGCRSGVMLTENTKKDESKPGNIIRNEAPVRPDKLPCEVQFTKVKGEDYVVILGFLKDEIYEVFFGKYDNQIPHKSFNGFVEKKGKSKYILNFIDGIEIKQLDINKYFDNRDYEAATRLISTALRHGTPVYYIIEQLQKSSPSIVEYGSAISRVLKKYLKNDDIKRYGSCKSCGSSNIEIKSENGCITIVCNNCSNVDSKCD